LDCGRSDVVVSHGAWGGRFVKINQTLLRNRFSFICKDCVHRKTTYADILVEIMIPRVELPTHQNGTVA